MKSRKKEHIPKCCMNNSYKYFIPLTQLQNSTAILCIFTVGSFNIT